MTQEMTNQQMDTDTDTDTDTDADADADAYADADADADAETPVNAGWSRTTRIEFIQSENGATRIRRRMPRQLRGLVAPNDHETFCDKIDLILDLYHESDALFGFRLCCLATFWVLSIPTVIGLGSLPSNIFVEYLIRLLSFLIAACAIAMCAISCKYCYDHAVLLKQIHAECFELTNRTGGNATFQLETKYESENSDNSAFKFSYINVLINDTVPLTQNNFTDDNVIAYSEQCYNKQ